jgi:hypothetical protein
MRQSGLVVT